MTGFEQMYWITRLDAVRSFFGWMMGLAVIALIAYLIGLAIIYTEGTGSLREDESYINWNKRWKPWKVGMILSFIIGFIGITLAPSKNDALLIMGGGTVLEYIENNEDLGKIPDNAIKALSEWSDNFLDEQRTKHQE